MLELAVFGKLLGLRVGTGQGAFNQGKSHLLICKLFELHYIQTLQKSKRERRASVMCNSTSFLWASERNSVGYQTEDRTSGKCHVGVQTGLDPRHKQ